VSMFAIIREALRIGRTHKSLWLFGFLVGLGPGSGSGGGGGGQVATPAAATPPDPGVVTLIVLCVIALLIGFVILKFVSTGALIEGVKRARGDGKLGMREGFREGWAHWGVLFRLSVTYFLVNAVSLAVLTGVVYGVGQLFGGPALIVAAILALLIAVPWLVTLYSWQAFAERIAVLENRRTIDAIRKARLFLHGRLELSLKLLVASFLGVLAIGAVGVLVMLPLGGLAFASSLLVGNIWAGVLGAVTLLPVIYVVISMIGIMTSSVWTIGYLTQVER